MNHLYSTTDGKVLEVFVGNETDLRIKVASLDCHSWKLTDVGDFSWSCKVKVKIELLCIAEVLETATNHRIPVALVALHDRKSVNGKDIECCLLYLKIKTGKCVPIRTFSVQNHVLEEAYRTVKTVNSSSNIQLIDGPSVLFWRKSSLSLFCCNEGTALSNIKFALRRNCNKECGSRETLCEVFQCYCMYKRTIIFISTNVKNACTSCCKQVGFHLVVLEFKDRTFSKLDASLFIPEEFHDSLNSMYLCNINLDISSVISSEIYASTKNGFILLIRNGQLKKCVSLHENIMAPDCTEDIHINCIEIEDKHYVIAKNVNAYIILDQLMKIQKQYQDMQHMLYGDFIGNGTVQCLFVKSQSVISSQWVLDDFNQLCITSGHQGSSSMEEETDESAYTATRALQSRLQQERLVLQQHKQSLLKKKEFLREMVLNQLQPTTASCDITKPNVNLVTLIEGQSGEFKDTTTASSGSRCLVDVFGVWQKTLDNKWCIGVEFYWNAECSAEIWLQAIPYKNTGSPLLTRSTSVICRSESSSEPQRNLDQSQSSCQKRQKIDSSTSNESDDLFLPEIRTEPEFTAMCVADIPQFFQSSISVCLILKWRYLDVHCGALDTNKNGRPVNDMLCDFSDRKVLTQKCGEVTLESGAVITGQYEIPVKVECDSANCDMDNYKDVSRSKLAWKAIQTCTDLIIHSSAGVLAQLDQLLVQRCQLVYNPTFQCYITSITTLNNVQLELLPSTNDASRKMRVYTGSERELFLLLHHLYKCLPDHMVILPDRQENKHLQEILSRIQQETSFYSDGVRKLLDNHDKKTAAVRVAGEEDVNDQTADIRHISGRFKRKREEIIQKEKETVDISDLEDFTENLTLFQRKTDSSIAIENS